MNVKLFLLPVLFVFGFVFVAIRSFTNFSSTMVGICVRCSSNQSKEAHPNLGVESILTTISETQSSATLSLTIAGELPITTTTKSKQISTDTSVSSVKTTTTSSLPAGSAKFATISNLSAMTTETSNSTSLLTTTNRNSTRIISTKLMTLDWIGFDHGTGNLMFQYASLLGLAGSFDRTPVLNSPPPDKLLKVFNLTVQRSPDNLTWHQIPHDCNVCNDKQRYNVTHDNIRIGGYLQYFGVFHHIKDKIRSEFKFQPQTRKMAEARMELIKSEYCKSPTCLIIGVHVRRGDFLFPHINDYGLLPAADDYYAKAVSWFKGKFPQKEIVFAVLGTTSDVDIQYNRQRFASIDATSAILIPKTAELDLCFLSLCDHLIMTTGTFGWWGGYLGNGNVTYSARYIRPGSQMAANVKVPFYPDDWIEL